ncbi:hypothetical protein H5410_031346 [Solanum commersonii]|uniref:Uncharacterized protein n=1 Tax=Solanum commersonii TaxID=4109 RepID=A0A9J5YJX5_SOLCO|nr:hypothetical protein H5410_031346 [Solanum commersonii]
MKCYKEEVYKFAQGVTCVGKRQNLTVTYSYTAEQFGKEWAEEEDPKRTGGNASQPAFGGHCERK